MKKVYERYVFVKDHPLSGKKKGDVVFLQKVSPSLKEFVVLGDSKEAEAAETSETPTVKWKNEDIIVWLAENGVEDAKGTKEELLKEVKKVLKA